MNIALAKEILHQWYASGNEDYLEFTQIVDHLLLSVVQHEREECAQICESMDVEAFGVLPIRAVMISGHCAKAIRSKQ